MPPIKSLSPEQEALIPVYREKWRSLILSTERIDRPRAEGALKAAYLLAGKTEPEFRFLNGPGELKQFQEQQSALDILSQLGTPIFLLAALSAEKTYERIHSEIDGAVSMPLENIQLSDILGSCYQIYSLATHPFSKLNIQAFGERLERSMAERRDALRHQPGGELLITLGNVIQQAMQTTFQGFTTHIWQPLANQPFMQPLVKEWGNSLKGIKNVFDPTGIGLVPFSVWRCACLDFYTSILNFSDTEMKNLATIRSVLRSCGISVMAFEKVCIVIERPTKILLDAEGQLHADDEPAVTFADGTEFYVHHGEFQNTGLGSDWVSIYADLGSNWRDVASSASASKEFWSKHLPND